MVTASTPGKIILFGEHAVVYGQPALAVPVPQVQARVTVAPARRGYSLEAPDIHLRADLADLPSNHPLAATARSVFTELGIATPPPFRLRITSSIPVASGLGSGAAVTVAVLRALSAFLGQPLPDERVSALAFDVEKLYHGTPSGIDNSVVTYARPVYFVKDRTIETLRVGAPLTLVIADTGIAALTRQSVADVRRLWESDPRRWEAVFERIGEIVRAARRAIEAGNIPALGPLMDENQARLQELTVSSPELDRLVEAARGSGALGAKLSGGGRGGNMIALVRPQEAEIVARTLQSAGARQTIITTLS
jgi:mevalonate kinase